jgi:hypothetical protein
MKCFNFSEYNNTQISIEPNETVFNIEPVIIPCITEPNNIPESVDNNSVISSALSKFFNRHNSFETISDFGLMKNNIKHFYVLSDKEKENLKMYTEEEKIELIILYDKILYALKHEYVFFPIEKYNKN